MCVCIDLKSALAIPLGEGMTKVWNINQLIIKLSICINYLERQVNLIPLSPSFFLDLLIIFDISCFFSLPPFLFHSPSINSPFIFI